MSLRQVDERCESFVSGEFLVRLMPGCRITHRMRIDDAWMGALETARELACQWALTDRAIEQQVNAHLDLLDDQMSGLERRIIIGYALGKADA